MMKGIRHLECIGAALLTLALAGCPPPPSPEPATVAPRAARAVASWPPARIEQVPGRVALPWPQRPGAEIELWRIDLLEIDRPELPAWLEDWEPRPALLARRVPVDASSVVGGQMPIQRPGAYVVRSRARGEANVGLVLASRLRLALLLEDSDLEVLCAAARSGQPVQGAFVRVVYRTERLGADRVVSASGTTDATGRWHTSLVEVWNPARVVDALPEDPRATLVVLISAEPPAMFARRLRELAGDQRMDGRLLAAWCLTGHVREDLARSLLDEGRLAGLGLAEDSLIDRRRAAETLAALRSALEAHSEDRRVEQLPGPFLWHF